LENAAIRQIKDWDGGEITLWISDIHDR